LPKDRIRVNCTRAGGILTLLILSTGQSGEKAAPAFFGKGGSPQSDIRAIMAKQPFVLTDEITPPMLVRAGLGSCLRRIADISCLSLPAKLAAMLRGRSHP